LDDQIDAVLTPGSKRSVGGIDDPRFLRFESYLRNSVSAGYSTVLNGSDEFVVQCFSIPV